MAKALLWGSGFAFFMRLPSKKDAHLPIFLHVCPFLLHTMIPALRKQFNESFREEAYKAFLAEIHPKHTMLRDFRIAETPVFAHKAFKEELLKLFEDVKATINAPGFSEKMDGAVPPQHRVPNENRHPHFLAIDAAVCQREDGTFYPQLIELQGVASLYCYQRHLCTAYQRHFNLPDTLTPFLTDDLTQESYVETLKRVILADQDPENVILLEIKPKYQKTRIDFLYTIRDLGIRPVCASEVIQEGEQVYYRRQGRKIPVTRIYNRVIFDELERRTDLSIQFNWQQPINAEWMAHPNWFFKISKYTMPFMQSPYVPETHFLSDLSVYPDDLENYVLKPLFSFAGAGVVFDVTKEDIEAVKNPAHHILQKKVAYAPFLPTPDVPAKAEVRMLCVWDGELKPLITLARLSKGKILGVDFNKDKTWVGSSAVFFAK